MDLQNKSVDYYAENGAKIGTEEINIIHQRRLIHKSVHVLVINSQEEIYIRKHHYLKKHYVGRWSCSVGAHIYKGDEPTQKAKLELASSLGLHTAVELLGRKRLSDAYENEMIYIFQTASNSVNLISTQETYEGSFTSVEMIKKLIENEETTPHLALAYEAYQEWKNSFKL